MNVLKIEVGKLLPNPFKKNINHGKMNEEQVTKIMSNMKELGLMGALPVFKKGDSYYLISGHHRIEAIKRTFGKNHVIPVIVHDYTEDNVLRGMVVENLSQRGNAFMEELANLQMIREHLKKQFRSPGERNPKGGRPDEPASVRDIYSWLNKNAEVMSIGKISQTLNIADELAPELLDKVKKEKGFDTHDSLGIKQAHALTKIKDHKEQKALAKLIQKKPIHQDDLAKGLSAYQKAPESIKNKVLSGEIDIQDINTSVEDYNFSNKLKVPESKKAAVITGKEVISELRRRYCEVNDQMYLLGIEMATVHKKCWGWFDDTNKRDFEKILQSYGQSLEKQQKIAEKLSETET